MTDDVGNRSGDRSSPADTAADAIAGAVSGSAQLTTVLAMLEDAAVPVALLDGRALVLHAGASFARACGRPVAELEGEPLTAWMVDDDRASVEAIVGEVADGATDEAAHRSTEARSVGADGRVRPMRLHFGVLAGTGDAVRLMCIAHDRTAERRRERNERRARMAEATAETTDPATGLPNRRGLELALASAARRSRNSDSPYALIRCELGVEDATRDYGTLLDDEVMRSCVDRVRQRLRPADTVAAPEHAELVVVAEDLHDEQDAAGVAYRLLSTVVEPLPTDGGAVSLRMVVGVAMADAATPPHALTAASTEAAHDAREPGGFRLMDLRGLDG